MRLIKVDSISKFDLISREAALDTLDRMNKALDTDRTVDEYYELLKACFEVLPAYQTERPTAEIEDIKSKIDKLPRIKVGNSNSPTVKYCIDERLLYEILEKMKGE